MYTPDQIDSILYQSYVKIGDIAVEVTDLKNKGVRCECLYEQGNCLINYMSAYEKGKNLTDKQKEALLNCIIKVSEIRDYPSAAPLLFVNRPTINVGQIGPKGIQGETGAQGVTGDDGADGGTGGTGPQGPVGDEGDQGLTGAQGGTGGQGIQGDAGDQGIQGTQGIDGPQGPDGVTGPTGVTGDQGPTGGDGGDGAAGPTGPTGATGPAGADGTGAPAYGQIYTHEGVGTQAVVDGVPELMTQWESDGISSSGISPDQANNKISLTEAGTYLITIDASFSGTNSSNWIISARSNVDGGGAAEILGAHIERKLGTGGDTGATSLSVLYTLDEGSTAEIETWIEGDGANNFVLTFGGMSVVALGAQGPTGPTGATGPAGGTGATGGTGGTGPTGATGPAGALGKAFVVGDPDITLTAAKVTIILGGSYTPEAPYVASVFFDNRADKTSPPAITGDMTGHTIQYNGTDWFDNGIWRGPQGIQGVAGPDGDDGAIGPGGSTGATGSTGSQGIQGINRVMETA